MGKKLFEVYKTPLLISVTLAVVLIATAFVKTPFAIILIVAGSLVGTFVLDLEYLLYAYFLEPNKDFSKTLVSFLKHGDILNAMNYIQIHKDEIRDKSLNSAIFQIVFGIFSIFAISTTRNYFAKALILSIFANSIYRLIEHYYKGKLDEWFWAFKNKPDKQGFLIYTTGAIVVFVYCLSIF